MSIENEFFNALQRQQERHDNQFLAIIELLKLKQISQQIDELKQIIEKGFKKIMPTLDEVLQDVSDEKTQIDSLTTLTAGIKKQLDDVLAGSLTPAQQAKVDAIFAAVEANKQEVVDSINANTTPTPPPPPTP